MTNEQLQALLADMSLDEKIGQMVQLTADFFGKDTLITGPMGAVHVNPQEARYCGTILGTSGAAKLKEIQKKAMEEQPHHIPMLFMLDVINGYQTIFPIPLAQGCSFEPELAREGAEIAAKEAAAAGLHVTFSPMLDLVRDARWGRVMESPGEDPYLNGCFAKAMVEGYQGAKKEENGQHPIKEGRLAACLKHFAGYGYPEGGREYDNVELSERTFRQDYLTAYAEAVKADCCMAMTSFNTLNRIPSSANKWLMRDILRGEMGFDGVLISDYSAVEELIPHGIAEDKREAAKLAIEAGVDIDMMSDVYLHHLKGLVEDGEIDEALIDEAVMRILKLKNDLGLFEQPDKDACEEDEEKVILCQEHRDAARRAAAKTFVLFKNEDGILPLKKEEAGSLLAAGPYLDSRYIDGSWSFPKDIHVNQTIRERILEKTGEHQPVFEQGCSMFEDGYSLKGKTMEGMRPEEMERAIEKTVQAAGKAERVVLCLGEHYQQTGEGASFTSLRIPKCQMELLRRVSAVNSNVVTVLFTGRPIEVKEIEELSKAVLCVWMPGTEGAGAIADVLFGDAEPTGRLSMSFPYATGQEPIYYNRFQSGRPKEPGENPAFRTGYLDRDYRPYHSFGYGMGYTSWSYGPVTVAKKEPCDDRKNGYDRVQMGMEDTLTASVELTNTGRRTGTETVQMYLRDVTGSVVRPLKELKGFEKVTLAPGETRTVTFEISEPMLRFYRADMSFGSEPGRFEVYIGADSMTKNKAEFFLKI